MSDTFQFGSVGTPKSTPKKPGGSVGTIQHLADQGLLAFEIGWVRSVRVSEKTCQTIKEAAVNAGVALSVHAPYYINLNADGKEWPKSRKRLMDAAYYGHLAGATDIVFHPGSYFEEAPEKVLEIAIPRLRECVEELHSKEISVSLRPETMGKGSLLGSLDDTLVMSREIEGVDPCLDFAHLHARAGDGTVNSYDEWSQMLEDYANALGKSALKRLHCHLSGIEYSEKGERKHLMLAESDFDLQALIQALHDHDCAGRILCESPEYMDKDALIVKAAWQKVSAT
ncbi:MAG: TIM barrel protein [Anaerolineales bacterium]|nr:TIM barrel protein [Anaerolineales bacterium]